MKKDIINHILIQRYKKTNSNKFFIMNQSKNINKSVQPEPETKTGKKDFGYFSDVLKMVGGNGFVQVIKTILSPIISRLFLPEYFGVLQNFSSIANIFAILSSLRYDQTVILPKKDEQAVNQFAVSIFFIFLTTPITIILVWFFKDDAARLLRSPELENYLWFVPLYVLALGSFNALKQWNTRKRQYLRLSAAQVASEVVSDGMTTGFGLANLANSNTMILARIAGQLIGSITLGYLILKEDGKYIISQIRWKLMKEGISIYRKFPLYNIWSSFLSNATLYIPGLLLSGYFSPTEAGYFSMGNNVLRLPVALIASSIGQVFSERSAKSFHDGQLAKTVLETYKRLVIFGLFPMLVLTIIGKELFILAFGAKWAEAGVYSQILSIWTFFVFLVSPMSNLTNILGKNEFSVFINFIKVITSIGSFVIGGITGNARLGLWLFSISGIITYALFVGWVNNASGIPVKRTVQVLMDNLLFSFPFLGFVLVFKLFNPIPNITLTSLNLSVPYMSLVLFSALIGILYYVAVIKKDPAMKEAIFNLVVKLKTKNLSK